MRRGEGEQGRDVRRRRRGRRCRRLRRGRTSCGARFALGAAPRGGPGRPSEHSGRVARRLGPQPRLRLGLRVRARRARRGREPAQGEAPRRDLVGDEVRAPRLSRRLRRVGGARQSGLGVRRRAPDLHSARSGRRFRRSALARRERPAAGRPLPRPGAHRGRHGRSDRAGSGRLPRRRGPQPAGGCRRRPDADDLTGRRSRDDGRRLPLRGRRAVEPHDPAGCAGRQRRARGRADQRGATPRRDGGRSGQGRALRGDVRQPADPPPLGHRAGGASALGGSPRPRRPAGRRREPRRSRRRRDRLRLRGECSRGSCPPRRRHVPQLDHARRRGAGPDALADRPGRGPPDLRDRRLPHAPALQRRGQAPLGGPRRAAPHRAPRSPRSRRRRAACRGLPARSRDRPPAGGPPPVREASDAGGARGPRAEEDDLGDRLVDPARGRDLCDGAAARRRGGRRRLGRRSRRRRAQRRRRVDRAQRRPFTRERPAAGRSRSLPRPGLSRPWAAGRSACTGAGTPSPRARAPSRPRR